MTTPPTPDPTMADPRRTDPPATIDLEAVEKANANDAAWAGRAHVDAGIARSSLTVAQATALVAAVRALEADALAVARLVDAAEALVLWWRANGNRESGMRSTPASPLWSAVNAVRATQGKTPI